MGRSPPCPRCDGPETRRIYTRAPRSQGGGFEPLGWVCSGCRTAFYRQTPPGDQEDGRSLEDQRQNIADAARGLGYHILDET